MRISDWSSDVCSSDLGVAERQGAAVDLRDVKWALGELIPEQRAAILLAAEGLSIEEAAASLAIPAGTFKSRLWRGRLRLKRLMEHRDTPLLDRRVRSEEHTSELQSLMRISYAVFCLKKKNKTKT